MLSLSLIFLAGYYIPKEGKEYISCKRDSIRVRVISNGFHTALILPVKNEIADWSKILPVAESYKFIEFGWGDKGYYMSKKDFPVGKAFSALFWPTESVMHVVYYSNNEKITRNGFKIKTIFLCSKEYIQLSEFINNSFARKEGIEYLGKGMYGISAFYKARRCYHVFYTCNTWLADGLYLSGVKTALLPITASSVMYHIENQEL